mmetsp:Transcript_15868/g.29060  ORF Transcript_15868/g.29060 Transcript_15868/m.29060 type:complete len:281 (+) Transcript_15868:259-1101(+)
MNDWSKRMYAQASTFYAAVSEQYTSATLCGLVESKSGFWEEAYIGEDSQRLKTVVSEIIETSVLYKSKLEVLYGKLIETSKSTESQQPSSKVASAAKVTKKDLDRKVLMAESAEKLCYSSQGERQALQEKESKKPQIGYKVKSVELTEGTILRVGDTYIEVREADNSHILLSVNERSYTSNISLDPNVPEHIVGRNRTCSIKINDTRASNNHAIIKHRGSRWVYEDDSSRNGTWKMLHTLISLAQQAKSASQEVGDETQMCDGDCYFTLKEIKPLLQKPL